MWEKQRAKYTRLRKKNKENFRSGASVEDVDFSGDLIHMKSMDFFGKFIKTRKYVLFLNVCCSFINTISYYSQ